MTERLNVADEPQWVPLQHIPQRTLTPMLGEQARNVIGSFGTCGDPNMPDYISWRQAYLAPVLEEYGLTNAWYNPEVPVWKPQFAQRESIEFARDQVLAIAVTNQTKGEASIMEAGMGSYSGMARGQEVFVFIDDLRDAPEETYRARMLAKMVLEQTEQRYPFFTLASSVERLARDSANALSRTLRYQQSLLARQITYRLPPPSDLTPAIYLSGTSGATHPAWLGYMQDILQNYQVPLADSYRSRWDEETAEEELYSKLGHAVQLIAITGETESLGALAELGPRLMHGEMAQQSVGVFIEPHPSAPNSPSNRARTLARAHLQRLAEDFPHVPVFVARDLRELAIFGLSEYFKYRQHPQ